MSQHRPHARATYQDDKSASSNVRLRAHPNASSQHQQPTPPASKGPSRSSPTRSSPSRGSRARPSAPPPGLDSRPHGAQPPYSAATAMSAWVGARGREYTDALGEPVDASNTASKHVAGRARPLRDESSFIDHFFFASGETVQVAPAALGPDAQVEDVTSDVNHHRDEETGGAMANSDVLGVRVPGVGHASTSTSASSDAAGTPARTQSRFSSWFHEPAQEDSEREDGLTVTGWENRKAQLPSVAPESGSWRRRPSDPPRREERPADDTKSWRRGPPGVMPAIEPIVRGASSPGHSATRPAGIGREKLDQQRKPPRGPRDRGRDDPEDKDKKDGSSRRSVAPPPGFASAGEQKQRIISPPPGFGQDLAMAKESQLPDSPVTAVPSPHGDGSQDAAKAMTSQHDVDHVAVAKTSDSGGISTDHPPQPEVGSLLGYAAPHFSAPPLQASAPSVSACNPRTRSLKNYLPAARSNAKSLPSLAATLPLSFSAATSAASSPFPPLGQQQPFSAPLATLSPPPHFLSPPPRPGLAPLHSPGLRGSMHQTDGAPFPPAQLLSGAYTTEYASGIQSLTYAPRLGKDQRE